MLASSRSAWAFKNRLTPANLRHTFETRIPNLNELLGDTVSGAKVIESNCQFPDDVDG